MFGFLVGDENLEVVKVALAVVTPWSLELLVEIWVSLALLRHLCGRGGEGVERFSREVTGASTAGLLRSLSIFDSGAEVFVEAG